MGRPSKFDEAMCVQAEKLCKLGATDKELADFFEVSESTLSKWKVDYPEFSEALKSGKEMADAEVGNRLFQRAIGYSHPDVHISNYQGEITKTETVKHYAPDTTACIFWLKNRRPDLWRDRVEHTGKDGGPIETREVTDDEIARWMAFETTKKVLKKAAQEA
jgi:hypothetical protein